MKTFLASVLVVSTLASTWHAGVRINSSRSIPLGVYRADERALIQRENFVIVCPPATRVFIEARERGYLGPGFCLGNLGYLIKRVAAVPGDRVTVRREGVWVNGQHVPDSAQRSADGQGRQLQQYRAFELVLAPTEYLLMSCSSRTGFDARYFGPVTRAHILSVVRPVITWRAR